MTLRAAVVGCGRIGSELAADRRVKGIQTHAAAYAACSETSLVAVCDVDPERLARCGDRWGVRARYASFQRMLDELVPDLVSICTPDETHAELVGVAIEAGVRAIVCEKPLALHPEEGRLLVQAAKERGVVLAVNYIRRQAESHAAVRDALARGELGTVQAVSGLYTKGTLHSGTHWFDLVRFFLGEVDAVSGFDGRRESGVDPTLDAVLELRCGAVAHLLACTEPGLALFEMDLVGTRGRIRLSESGHSVQRFELGECPHYHGYRSYLPRDSIGGGLGDVTLSIVADVVRCLRDGGTPRCSGEDALAALEIACAVRESARTGRRIELLR